MLNWQEGDEKQSESLKLVQQSWIAELDERKRVSENGESDIRMSKDLKLYKSISDAKQNRRQIYPYLYLYV